jgi:hypothetical protein
MEHLRITAADIESGRTIEMGMFMRKRYGVAAMKKVIRD